MAARPSSEGLVIGRVRVRRDRPCQCAALEPDSVRMVRACCLSRPLRMVHAGLPGLPVTAGIEVFAKT
jgi:hypothetical protein